MNQLSLFGPVRLNQVTADEYELVKSLDGLTLDQTERHNKIHQIVYTTSLLVGSGIAPRSSSDVSFMNIPVFAHQGQRPRVPTYVKKDDTQLGLSLVIDKEATYLLLKGKSNYERKVGSQKSVAAALCIPADQTRPAYLVYQLVNRDELSLEAKEGLANEFSQQAQLAKEGICPQVLGVFDYTKNKKDGSKVEKRCAFVEAFDSDLKAFDALQMKLPDGSDPRPFALTQEQIIFIGKSIAEHLSVLHGKNRAHMDLGLENIGVSFDLANKKITKVLLCDFGLSLDVSHEVEIKYATYGHLLFTAPEFFRNDPNMDLKKCDIYALGVLLSMLITPESEARSPMEPAWIDLLTEIEIEAQNSHVLPKIYNDDGTPTEIIAQVLQEQEEYKNIVEESNAAINNGSNPEAIHELLIAIMLNPDPAKRPTAEEVVALCNTF